MRRREFLGVLGGAAAWPLGVHAQQSERVRRVGVLMTLAADDPESQRRITAFAQRLQQIGWTDGRNLRVEYRWSAGAPDRMRRNIEELLALAPDVILATAITSVEPLLRATRTVPVVFVIVPDPVGTGIVDSLARPGGNVTGFTDFDYGMSAKLLELLKQIAPGVTRVGVLRDPASTVGIGQLAAIQTAAPSLGADVRSINLRSASEIDRAITVFAQSPNGGLIVTGSALALIHRNLIVALAARHKLPTVYWNRAPVAAGGLMSYGSDLADQYRQAATYVDRILKGEKPGDLPVQSATKYELVINLKTAKALGLDVPLNLQQRADEVIE